GNLWVLPLLAHHRHSTASLVAHRDRGRCARIHRPGQRTAVRLPDRVSGAGTDLPGLFPDWSRGRAHQGVRQPAALFVPVGLWSVRRLPRAALPTDAHGVARGAILDDRIGLVVCLAFDAVGPAAGTLDWPCLSVADRGARTLQASPHAVR